MKKIVTIFAILLSTSFSFAGPNDSQLTEREQVQKDIERNRQEINNSTTTPNSKSAPTKVNVESWGINSNAKFDITNHLFGYSTLIDKDSDYDGVKLTGFFNVAYYNPRKANDGTRKKSKFEIGFEEPVWDLTSRSALFVGGGGVFGFGMGLYLDTGIDYHILSWFKAQAGLNYASANGHVSPKISLGFTW